MRTDLPPEGPSLTRRCFVQSIAAVGLMLAVEVRFGARAGAVAPAADSAFAPNAFVRITPDNWVTVIVKHHEMGQGTTTGIATLVAEELDADFARVRAEYAPSDPTRYSNSAFGKIQGTGGSSAMKAGWTQMRTAGAAARAMLVEAAAKAWQVPASEVVAAKSELSHASGKRATFGAFAAAAGALAVPDSPKLKDPSAFTLIGKGTTRRLDSLAKCTGKAQYTIDVALPGLLTAVIARPPAFGATLRSFDARAAKQVPGVTDVVEVEEGVAIVAKGMWPALRGRALLQATWDRSKSRGLTTEQIVSAYTRLAEKPGAEVVAERGAADAFKRAARTLEALYVFPYLAHAPMEPLNCVAWLHDGELETWSGHQLQTVDHKNAAEAASLPLDKVKLHTLISGGSFGRRANQWSDYVVEAVHVAKAIGGRAPVRVQRTREDDLRAGLYRPLFVHAVRAALDEHGQLLAFEDTIVGQSIHSGGTSAGHGVDKSSVEGIWPTPYALPLPSVSLHSPAQPVRVLWWRSVGHTHTAFVMETMMDELAEAAKQDPVAFRLALLKEKPKHRKVLALAAEKAGWNVPVAAGKARGIAMHESFDTVVAQVVELSLKPDGMPRVERVVVAVDCGTAINPDIVHAQMEGGVGYALSAALYSEINIEEGAARESNFHDYRALRIEEMPKVEVYLVPSNAAPTGVGEPGVPPLAPALANAFYKLSGERVRRLPFGEERAQGPALVRELRKLVDAASALRRAAQGNGQPEALVATVVEVDGPGYRQAGARALFSREAWLAGSVSGGCLERDIARRGFWRTRDADAVLVTYDATDDERQGSGCDGTVRVLLQRCALSASHAALVVAERCLAEETCARLVTVVRSRSSTLPVGSCAVRYHNGKTAASHAQLAGAQLHSLTDALPLQAHTAPVTVSAERCDVLVELVSPPPHLFIFGAAHDAQALVRFAELLGWTITLCLPGPAPAGRFSGVDHLLVGDFESHVRALDRSVCPLAVIMGHHYQHDLGALRALLGSRARYIGLLGARTRAARLQADAGLSSEAAQALHAGRLHAPVGLELGAEGPDEIALSIVAEAQAVLRGASAQRRSASASAGAGVSQRAARLHRAG